jgi:branched-chain amino acid transport system permease protein
MTLNSIIKTLAEEDQIRVKLIVVAALVIFPFVTPSVYSLSLLTRVFVLGLFALSYDILIGYTGLVSFGHSLPYGFGAYGVTILVLEFDVAPLPSYFVALMIVIIVSVLVGMIALRLTGIFFAIITLAFAQLVHTFIIQGGELTGGADGIPGMPRPDILSAVPLPDPVTFYLYALSVLLIAYVLIRHVLRSPFGRVFQAIKENEQRINMLGVNTYWYKVASFALAGAFAGVAGILHVQFLGFTDPGLFYWTETGDVLFVTLIGGMGTLVGPLVGAGTLIIFEDLIGELFRPEAGRLILGFAFVLVILFLPKGVMGVFDRIDLADRVENRLSWLPPSSTDSRDSE